MAGYHSPQLEVEVRLNTNEAPEPPPEAFLEALAAEVALSRLNRYPDRDARELREALAAHHGVRPSQVFCANGSNEVLQSLLLAYGGPGRSVAVFEPTYALHSHIARITGTGVVEGERGPDFLLDSAELDRVLAVAAATDLEGIPGDVVNPVITFVCSPNNPTGRLEPIEIVNEVLAKAPGLVVVDEAYGQFARRSALELLDARPRLVVVRTFSKTWSLAGLRLGYAVADEEVVASMERVALPYHLDSLKQIAGRLALE
ncbi:MAG: hisC, partial [Acidimicrobiaceae bacterium]|nr:hisC [Acidimicrobiaceae bacterium]